MLIRSRPRPSVVSMWALVALVAALVPAAVVLAAIESERHVTAAAGGGWLIVGLGAFVAALSAIAGVLIVRGERRNAVGWLLLGSSVLLAANLAGYGYTDLALYGGERWPAATWTASVTYWTFIPAVFVAPALVAQLFPNGTPLPGPWRLVLRASIALGAASTLAALLTPAQKDSYTGVTNPLAAPGLLGHVARTLDAGGPVLAPPIFALSVAALVVRFRRSRGIQRQQLKWLASAGTVPVAAFALSFVVESIDSDSPLLSVIFVGGFASLMLIPLAIGVAIRRYHLYEIDRLISRTLVYGSLTVGLGAVYAGLVLAGQEVFSSFAGGSKLAVAASTLVVAALFLPVRARVQRVVDRRFYRRRYDAQRTLASFGSRLRQEIELEGLRADLEHVVGETMQPAHVSLWLRGRTP